MCLGKAYRHGPKNESEFCHSIRLYDLKAASTLPNIVLQYFIIYFANHRYFLYDKALASKV
jgi:hypothetical protein